MVGCLAKYCEKLGGSSPTSATPLFFSGKARYFWPASRPVRQQRSGMAKILFPYFTQNSVKQFTRTREGTNYSLKKED